MNTGVKQRFNLINLGEDAIHDDCTTEAGNKLTSVAEIVATEGKSVGAVTTARITHATPAAVYAKTANRNWEGDVPEEWADSKDIAAKLLDQMEAGVIDLAMGGGRRYFVPEDSATDEGGTGRRKDGQNLIERATGNGMQYALNTATFNELTLDGAPPCSASSTTATWNTRPTAPMTTSPRSPT